MHLRHMSESQHVLYFAPPSRSNLSNGHNAAIYEGDTHQLAFYKMLDGFEEWQFKENTVVHTIKGQGSSMSMTMWL